MDVNTDCSIINATNKSTYRAQILEILQSFLQILALVQILENVWLGVVVRNVFSLSREHEINELIQCGVIIMKYTWDVDSVI